MELKDLVGKMAIRTQKARGFAPWETDRAIRLDFMVPVPIFDDREREVYEYYIAEEEKTVAQIASEECVSEKTVYKDIGNACKIIAVYLLGV